MRLNKHYIPFIAVCFAMLWLPLCLALAQTKQYIVVIDAGHGGHDPGAIGKISREKNINLSVALKLGKMIQTNCSDTKVIYTREKDVFVPLARRAEIANEAKADLFISIHTNSLGGNRKVKGASTWTLGLAKSDANLEVAKRENAVILYEDDYQTRYAGFNPNSSESYIIFEFMQDKYMSQSVHLASLVQKEFKQTAQRADRGVHQAGFLVLKASAMPSILVELGFISTPEEERYLNTESGRNALAKSIYRAFITYKKEQEARRSNISAPSAPSEGEKRDEATQPANTPVFKVQILASTRLIPQGSKEFKGVKEIARQHRTQCKNILCPRTTGTTAGKLRVKSLHLRQVNRNQPLPALRQAGNNIVTLSIQCADVKFKVKLQRLQRPVQGKSGHGVITVKTAEKMVLHNSFDNVSDT